MTEPNAEKGGLGKERGAAGLWKAGAKLYGVAGSALKRAGQVVGHPRSPAWVNVLTAALMTYFAYETSQFARQNMNLAQQLQAITKLQSNLERDAFLRTVPPVFSGKYTFIGPYEEVFEVNNFGMVKADRVYARFRFFFVFADGQVLTRRSLAVLLQQRSDLLGSVQRAGLLRRDVRLDQISLELERLVGGTREFYVGSIAPGEVRVLEISPSLNKLMTSLAESVSAAVVVRWRIDFENAVTREAQSHALFYLLGQKSMRANLGELLGGKGVIARVQEYEQEVPEEIFAKDAGVKGVKAVISPTREEPAPTH